MPEGDKKVSGIWCKTLESLLNDGAANPPKVKTVLVLSNCVISEKIIISRLTDMNKEENPVLFKGVNRNHESLHELDDGFGLGYTYMEARPSFDAERLTDPVMLEIYTLTYTSEKDLEELELFLHRLTKLDELVVLDIFDVASFNKSDNDASVAKIFENRSRVCAQLKSCFSNDASNAKIRCSFISSKRYYSGITSKLASNELFDEVVGECDEPLGVRYALIVSGTDVLNGSASMKIMTAAECDKLQQLLRMAVLKSGGALFYIGNISEKSTKTTNTFSGILDFVLDARSEIKPSVDDSVDLIVPSGWDTWGKIRVLNESCDIEAWNKQWISLVNGKKHVVPPQAGAADLSYTDDYQSYQNFLRDKYKLQLQFELQDSESPSKSTSGMAKEVMENTTIMVDEPDISIASFQETHSVLHDFRQQFLEAEAGDFLQSTPGQPKFHDNITPGGNTAKFKDFFNELRLKERHKD